MKYLILICLICCLFACNTEAPNSTELITSTGRQDSLFKALIAATQNGLPNSALSDSLAFLVLPVQASCPSCRKKTIDSIVKHQTDLPDNHYIIVSASGGRKTIRGYFKEQEYELPVIPDHLFLDSHNIAYKNKLYAENPTLYYTYQQKAYRKVAAIPATVKEDLHEFFSGHNQQ